jgi:hypothetical protein
MTNLYSQLKYQIFITKEQFIEQVDPILHNNVLSLIHMLENQNISYSIIEGVYNDKGNFYVIVLDSKDYASFNDSPFQNIIVDIKDVN